MLSRTNTDDYRAIENHEAISDGSRLLAEYADQAYEAARLRRNDVQTTQNLVSAKMLAELEASGDAMRFVNANGRIAWRATPNRCQYLNDFELDAEDDLEDI